MTLTTAPPLAAEPPAESPVFTKAAYLYKFGAFVTWPAQAFPDPAGPVVIGVVADAPLARALASLVGERRLQGRRVAVRTLPADGAPDGLHVLFVGDVTPAQATELIKAVRSRPVLTVTDAPLQAVPGSMIRFTDAGRRLRFDVSPGVAEAAGLGISARLLSVAHSVEAP